MDGVEESILTLDARWRDAEARLDEQAGSLRALFDADEALQALVTALRRDSAAYAAELEALRLELNAASRRKTSHRDAEVTEKNKSLCLCGPSQ
ncbi:MAG: hypothetical protein FJW14_04385 [Acidimicrobiia bacterium]|nr:hypothetical protein [Acidimicrobiia bacterium]